MDAANDGPGSPNSAQQHPVSEKTEREVRQIRYGSRPDSLNSPEPRNLVDGYQGRFVYRVTQTATAVPNWSTDSLRRQCTGFSRVPTVCPRPGSQRVCLFDEQDRKPEWH